MLPQKWKAVIIQGSSSDVALGGGNKHDLPEPQAVDAQDGITTSSSAVSNSAAGEIATGSGAAATVPADWDAGLVYAPLLHLGTQDSVVKNVAGPPGKALAPTTYWQGANAQARAASVPAHRRMESEAKASDFAVPVDRLMKDEA
ncbi:TPA: hypothetical protein ACH3X1_014097 [Trebouxia sp. C0004]